MTWGAFSYPILFILTDLTTRLIGPRLARQVVMISLLPGLINSAIIATVYANGEYILPLRIAVASLTSYAVGQVLDITVFQRLRAQGGWWLAPAVSITCASVVDTAIFFFVAFYQCADPVLSANWPEIAVMDLFVKLNVNWIGVVPLYGLVLGTLLRKRALLVQ